MTWSDKHVEDAVEGARRLPRRVRRAALERLHVDTMRLITAVAVSLLSGCANEEMAYDFRQEFELVAFGAAIDDAHVPLSDEGCVDVDGRMRVCAEASDLIFDVGIQNLTDAEPIVVRWSASRYIDERGSVHRLIPYLDDDPFEIELLRGLQQRWQGVVGEGKRSRRSYQGHSVLRVEPAIPWEASASDEEERIAVAEFFQQQRQVSLIIPVSTAPGIEHQVRFVFRLRPRANS